MEESTLTFKYLNSLSEVMWNNTTINIFVTNKYNLLNCNMEEFVIPDIK